MKFVIKFQAKLHWVTFPVFIPQNDNLPFRELPEKIVSSVHDKLNGQSIISTPCFCDRLKQAVSFFLLRFVKRF
jgi:hypothetical protein